MKINFVKLSRGLKATRKEIKKTVESIKATTKFKG
jgi:hypothetical protein